MDLRAVIRRMAPGATPSFVEGLCAALHERGVSTRPRLACILGQCAHESGGFRILEENLNYTSVAAVRRAWPKRAASFTDEWIAGHLLRNPSALAGWAYDGRMGNWPGDGWRFRGRGPGQVTGRDNYARLGEKLGLPLDSEPELLATPAVGFSAFLLLWDEMRLDAYADRFDVEAISRAINCGSPRSNEMPNGLEDRKRWTRLALEALEAEPEELHAHGGRLIGDGTEAVTGPTVPGRNESTGSVSRLAAALRGSWTIRGALLAGIGLVVDTFDRSIEIGLEVAGQVAALSPVRGLLETAGANAGSAGVGLVVFGLVLVVGRRIEAAWKGKIG